MATAGASGRTHEAPRQSLPSLQGALKPQHRPAGQHVGRKGVAPSPVLRQLPMSACPGAPVEGVLMSASDAERTPPNLGLLGRAAERAMRKRVAVAVLSVSLSGCATHLTALPPPEEPAIVVDNPTCVSCGYDLSDAEVARLLSQAEAGDPDAAFRVWLHYELSGDRIRGMHWLRRAAGLGHAVAQYNLWFEMRSVPTCEERLDALAWLKKSAAQGFSLASTSLADYRDSEGNCAVPARREGSSVSGI